MLAKCAKCQKVFPTDHYGPNTCPACGAELMLADPMAANKPPEGPATGPGEQPPAGEGGAAPEPSAGAGTEGGAGAAPPQGVPAGWDNVPPAGPEFVPDEQLQPTPWEERATRGFFPALFETIKQSFVDPVNFFARMRTDDIVQPLFYYWIVGGFGALVGNLWQALFSAFGAASKPPELPAGSPLGPYFEWMMSMQSRPLALIGTAAASVAFLPVTLFIYAGILHLFAMLFRCANRGFSATLRAVAYSAGPMVLAAVPMCGSFIGGTWSLVLTVIGLWKLQRGTVGGAVGAIVTPMVLLFCCACIGIAAIAGVAGMAAAAAVGSAGN